MCKLGFIAVLVITLVGYSDSGAAPGNSVARARVVKDCLADGYVEYALVGPTEIPDGNSAGVTLGPIRISRRNSTIQGLVLCLELNHEYAGDLSIQLQYDSDNDGAFDATSPVELYLARLDPCEGEELWACHIAPQGEYFFKDEGWKATGEDASFEVFDGLLDGGSFYLSVFDTEAEQTGSITGWAIYVEETVGEMLSRRSRTAITR